MGTTADTNGISLQFVDEHNKATEPPIFGAHAYLHGIPRSEALQRTPLAPGEDEGSEHWMTLLAVADTKERLDAIVSTSAAPKGSCNTSCASHRVLVEIHVGNRRQTLKSRTVVASGPIVKMDPPEVNVVHVKVLPENVFITKEHPHVKESPKEFTKEFKGMKPLSAVGILAAADSLVKQGTAAAAASAAANAAKATGSPAK